MTDKTFAPPPSTKIRFLSSPDVPDLGTLLVKPNQAELIEKALVSPAASFLCTASGGGGGGHSGWVATSGSNVGFAGASNSNSSAVGYGSVVASVGSNGQATQDAIKTHLDNFLQQIAKVFKLSPALLVPGETAQAYKAERKKDSKPFAWAYGDSILSYADGVLHGSGGDVPKQEPQASLTSPILIKKRGTTTVVVPNSTRSVHCEYSPEGSLVALRLYHDDGSITNQPLVHKVEREKEDNVWLFSKENSVSIDTVGSLYSTDSVHPTEEARQHFAKLLREAAEKKAETLAGQEFIRAGEVVTVTTEPLTVVPYKEEMGTIIYNPKSVVSTINLDPDKPNEGTIRVVPNGKDIYLRGDWKPYTRVEVPAQTVKKAEPKTVNALVHKQLKSFRVQSDAQAYPRYSAHLDN